MNMNSAGENINYINYFFFVNLINILIIINNLFQII